MTTLYDALDQASHSIADFLNAHGKSKILRAYSVRTLASLVYANLILSFFSNLNQKNVNELKLPKGRIGAIKSHYSGIRKNARSTVSLKGTTMTAQHYAKFKSNLAKEYPEFVVILLEIEKLTELDRIQKYIKVQGKHFAKLGKENPTPEESIETTVLEAFVEKTGRLPTAKEATRIVKEILSPQSLHEMSQPFIDALSRNAGEMLAEQSTTRIEFEARLYETWKEPLDLLECLIRISTESGEEKAKALNETADFTNDCQRSALIQIHARAVHISNEILTLLKAGYADGAFARWRSLHELAVISFFLRENSNETAIRFLEHEAMKSFKEMQEYQKYYRKLGYPPLERRAYNSLKKECEDLIKKYGKDFKYSTGYEWIPKDILSNRNLRGLEQLVHLSHWRPWYSMASNAVHGGSKGFFRLGLINQSELLLVGASDYGLADPIQHTAISLLHVTTSLLTIEPSLNDLLTVYAMQYYVDQAEFLSVNRQKEMEERESSMLEPPFKTG